MKRTFRNILLLIILSMIIGATSVEGGTTNPEGNSCSAFISAEIEPYVQYIPIGTIGTYILTLNSSNTGSDSFNWSTTSDKMIARINGVGPFTQYGSHSFVSTPYVEQTFALDVQPQEGAMINNEYWVYTDGYETSCTISGENVSAYIEVSASGGSASASTSAEVSASGASVSGSVGVGAMVVPIPTVIPTPLPGPAPSTLGSSSLNGPYSNEPINLATGNYIYQHQDLFIPGRGLSLAIIRSYNSMDFYNGSFGYGWTFNYNMNLKIADDGNVTVTRGDGRGDIYTLNPDGTYLPPLGIYDELTKNTDNSYSLTAKNQIKFNFASQGKLNNIVDRNGNQISLTYVDNILTKVIDSSGRELIFTYDAASRITKITDPLNRVWNYAYDNDGNLVQYSNPMGGKYAYTYDENHRMTSITDPRGNQIMTNTFDEQGRVASQTNAVGGTYTYIYDTENRKTSETDPLGRKKIYVYDEHFWGSSETDELGNIISYTYDGNGNRISTTNANGQTMQFIYDTKGNIIQITDPLNYQTSMVYDAKNNIISTTDALGRHTNLEYDTNNNLIKLTNTMNGIYLSSYDQYGQPTGATDANGNTMNFAYDTFGYPVSITDALGNTETFTYNNVGHLIEAINVNSNKYTYTYDNLDRLTGTTNPLGHTASNTYDVNGNRISFTDNAGIETIYAYNPLNQLIKVTDALDGTVQYNYDVIGNMISMIDANSHTTDYNYNQLNRLISITDPLGYVKTYSYDAVGNIISIKDANSNTTYFNYDSLNRLIKITYSNGQTVNYQYDAIGNRIQLEDNIGSTTYNYDGLNRLVDVTNPDGQKTSYQYDVVGNRIKTVYPDGNTISYMYNANNIPTGATDWDGHDTTYTYDYTNKLVSMTYLNGIKTEYIYDENNRLIGMTNKNGNQIMSSFEYTLDPIGNRLNSKEQFSKEFTSGLEKQPLITNYEYDKLYRITKVTYPSGETVGYSYDSMGNRVSMTNTKGNASSTVNYVYDDADRLLQAGKTTYMYDKNGNLITKDEKNENPGRTFSYSYDEANRLIEISKSYGSQKDLYSFEYDGDGNRISKTKKNETSKSDEYLWDVNSRIPQILTKTDKKDTTIYTYGIDLISMTDPKKGESYYHHDGLGNVRSLSDGKGHIKTVYLYDVFGQIQNKLGDGDNEFLFTGEQMDDEIGLIYLRARYYDPSIGRFINKDPIQGIGTMTQSLNRYVYTLNNPVNLIDPSGYSGGRYDPWDILDIGLRIAEPLGKWTILEAAARSGGKWPISLDPHIILNPYAKDLIAFQRTLNTINKALYVITFYDQSFKELERRGITPGEIYNSFSDVQGITSWSIENSNIAYDVVLDSGAKGFTSVSATALNAFAEVTFINNGARLTGLTPFEISGQQIDNFVAPLGRAGGEILFRLGLY